MTTRDFPVAVIASLSSGVLLCEFSEMHEAAEFLMGHPVWTHQFGSREFSKEIKATILEQCPGMPTELPGVTGDNYRKYVKRLEDEIGPTVKIRRGSGLTAMLPTDGIPDHLKDSVITVNTKPR